MKALITGTAGFIGSHLAERLLNEGYEVVGVDCFTNSYPREIKERNLEKILRDGNFTFVEDNLLSADLSELLRNVDYVFHEAAQAGVRTSWGTHFDLYVQNNILATQRLLEAAKEVDLKKFVYASSSSVYGDAETYPTHEEMTPRPISPYGVSKLAGENLCQLYWKSFGVPTIILRYFSVYGPRQRPDMAFHRFIRCMQRGEEIVVYGDGEQTRDFTFVDDVNDANVLAAQAHVCGEIFNIGGGSRITVNETIRILEDVMGKRTCVRYVSKQRGDVGHTGADVSKARVVLGYDPKMKMEEGLSHEIDWIRRCFL